MRSSTESYFELINIIGKDSAKKLVEYVDGGYFYIPKLETVTRSERNRAIMSDYNKGYTYPQLKVLYRLTERQIRKIIDNEKKSAAR